MNVLRACCSVAVTTTEVYRKTRSPGSGRVLAAVVRGTLGQHRALAGLGAHARRDRGLVGLVVGAGGLHHRVARVVALVAARVPDLVGDDLGHGALDDDDLGVRLAGVIRPAAAGDVLARLAALGELGRHEDLDAVAGPGVGEELGLLGGGRVVRRLVERLVVRLLDGLRRLDRVIDAALLPDLLDLVHRRRGGRVLAVVVGDHDGLDARGRLGRLVAGGAGGSALRRRDDRAGVRLEPVGDLTAVRALVVRRLALLDRAGELRLGRLRLRALVAARAAGGVVGVRAARAARHRLAHRAQSGRVRAGPGGATEGGRGLPCPGRRDRGG